MAGPQLQLLLVVVLAHLLAARTKSRLRAKKSTKVRAATSIVRLAALRESFCPVSTHIEKRGFGWERFTSDTFSKKETENALTHCFENNETRFEIKWSDCGYELLSWNFNEL